MRGFGGVTSGGFRFDPHQDQGAVPVVRSLGQSPQKLVSGAVTLIESRGRAPGQVVLGAKCPPLPETASFMLHKHLTFARYKVFMQNYLQVCRT